MKTIIIITFLFFIFNFICLLLFFINKRLLKNFILLIMKIIEKTILTSGENKFNLAVDLIYELCKKAHILITREQIAEQTQKIYNENRDTIKKCKTIVEMYSYNKVKDVIKNIENELCNTETKKEEKIIFFMDDL